MIVAVAALALCLGAFAAAPAAEPTAGPMPAEIVRDGTPPPGVEDAPPLMPAPPPAPEPVAAPPPPLPPASASDATPPPPPALSVDPELAPLPSPAAATTAAPAPGPDAAPPPAATLEVVNAKTGQVVFALMDAPASLQLTLKPGKYHLRRHTPQGAVVGKAVLKEGRQVEVPEVGVTLLAESEASWETTDAGPLGSLSTLRAHTMEAQLLPGLVHVFDGVGTGRVAFRFGLSWGLTDRLQLGLLDLAYRLGSRKSVELVPFLRLVDASALYDFDSLQNIGYVPGIDQQFTPSAGATLRGWVRRNWAINVAGEATLGVALATRSAVRAFLYGWEARGSAGFTRIFLNRIAINLGVGYGYFELRLPSRPPVGRHELVLGSAQSVGPRALPLVGVELADWLTLETHVTLKLRPGEPGTNELRMLVGTALTW